MSTWSRRDVLKGIGISSASVAATLAIRDTLKASDSTSGSEVTVDFRGVHQSGVVTPPPNFLSFVGFDLATQSASEVRGLLNTWTDVASHLVEGKEIGAALSPSLSPRDTGEASDLPPSSLTITIGYGRSFFERRETSRVSQPLHIADLPPYVTDNLDVQLGGGDVVFQICSDDPQVNFHAVHSLERSAEGVARLRFWHQGFGRTSAIATEQGTRRNLLGFKDGTNNLQNHEDEQLQSVVWVNAVDEPAWLQGGTYLVHRKIRTFIETWSAQSLTNQEAAIGRFRDSGSPLTGHHEGDSPDFSAVDQFGNFVIPAGAHIRNASPSANRGAKILRRGFSYADGLDRRSGQFDAGLHFVCFQKNPHTQFGTIQDTLSQNDVLANYLEHVSSTVAAIPRGLSPNQGWGDQIFAE